jgi:hypothetical protein
MFARRVHGNRFGVKLSDSVCDWVFGGQSCGMLFSLPMGCKTLCRMYYFTSIEIRCL